MARPKLHLHLKKNALHHALGVPAGHKLSASMIRQARHSKNAHMRKMAVMAENMRHWHHAGPKHGTGSGM